MNVNNNKHLSRLLPLTVTIALLSGCGANGVRSDGKIAIETVPPGASVDADGQIIGTTPLRMKPGDYYSAGMSFGSSAGIASLSYKGKLTLTRPGCQSYTTQVNDAILSRDIHIDLVCDASAAAVVAAPSAAPVMATTTATASMAGETQEQRLTRLKSLRAKGLISQQEYNSIRGEILKTL